MDEVMSDSNHRDEEPRRNGSEDVGKIWFLFFIDWVSCQSDEQSKKTQKDECIDFWLSLWLNFFDCHFLEQFSFYGSVESIFFKAVPWNLIFGITNVKFGKNLSGLLFIEVVNDEEIGDILALSHGQPVFSSWVPVNKWGKIIEFILNDPVFGVVITPKLSISFLLLVDPDLGTSSDSSGGQGFPVRFDVFNFHDIITTKYFNNWARYAN